MLWIVVFCFLFKEYSGYLILPTIDGKNETFEVNQLSSRRRFNDGSDPPEYFDWRERHMVSPVKNQLHCAACWAFAAVANIESHLKIYKGVAEILSEQFLIDCDEGEKGCDDGSIIETFANIVTKFGGVLRDRDYYPYADERKECRWTPDTLKYGTIFASLRWNPQPVPVIGFERVFSDEEVMARYVYEHGPLSAGINSESMDRYQGGIDEPTDQNCNPKKLNHAVLIVGYSFYVSKSGEKIPYWIIKNSWGPEWGDQGFYYLVRGRNACGIANDVSFVYV